MSHALYNNPSCVVQISERGQITLPMEIRKKLVIKAGDSLMVSIRDGGVVLEPALVMPVEHYTDERIQEFEQATDMTTQEITQAKHQWKI